MSEQTEKNADMPMGAASELSAGLCLDGYWCIVCGRFLPACDGVIVHDNVPHPEMTFDEEERPQ